MKIGIVGAGQIGGTLTRRLTALGHKIFVANSRGPETLSNLAAETGATAVSVPEAVRDVDLIVVTIPQKNIPNLPAGLFADTPDRVVVVETGNPLLGGTAVTWPLASRHERASLYCLPLHAGSRPNRLSIQGIRTGKDVRRNRGAVRQMCTAKILRRSCLLWVDAVEK